MNSFPCQKLSLKLFMAALIFLFLPSVGFATDPCVTEPPNGAPNNCVSTMEYVSAGTYTFNYYEHNDEVDEWYLVVTETFTGDVVCEDSPAHEDDDRRNPTDHEQLSGCALSPSGAYTATLHFDLEGGGGGPNTYSYWTF